MDNEQKYEAVIATIRMHQREGEVAELFISEDRKKIEFRPVGPAKWVQDLMQFTPSGVEVSPRPPSEQAYYFLSSDVRPGSGIIRVYGGKPQGPGGTLTCFLSSKDGRDNYFVAAGHVLSNFWTKEDLQQLKARTLVASIYRYQKGFPATNSTRFLGKLEYLSERPQPINSPRRADASQKDGPDHDIGIVKISGDIPRVQRTTCYGTFGEGPKNTYEKIEEGQRVMKCGAEETHHTFAEIENTSTPVTVYGPDGLLYQFDNQVILRTAFKPSSSRDTNPSKYWSAERNKEAPSPFAVAGDSGSMVVDSTSKRPVGMLIAGSVLDGRYVMTPIQSIAKFWEDKCFVLLRA